MSHLIATTQGKKAIAFVGETPWHGLGQELQAGASIEVWKQQSGLSYAIGRSPVTYTVNGIEYTMDGREVLYRDDTGAPLGVVSPIFKIVQPGEVLEFFRDLCDDQGFQLETAGAIRGGSVFWALAKTGHSMNLGKNGQTDRTDGYLLLSSGADGSHATDARFTSTRVVCNNTLTVALSKRSAGTVKTSHVSEFDPETVKKALGVIDFEASWTKFREQMLALQDVRVTDTQATEFFSELLRPKADRAKARADVGAQSFDELLGRDFGGAVNIAAKSKEPVERAIRGLDTLVECYQSAPGAAPGSAYGLVQGVTRYVDHERGKAGDARLTSAWFGTGNAMKQRALDNALALATAE